MPPPAVSALPPGAVIGVPQTAPPGNELLMPAPAAAAAPAPSFPTAPAAPAPSFPTAPAQSNYPAPAAVIRLGPPVAPAAPPAAPPAVSIRLLPPESATAPATRKSASSPVLPVGIAEFAVAIPDKLAAGRKPLLDGLDWLKDHGYRTALFLHRPGEPDAADRRQFAARGLTFLSLEVPSEDPAKKTGDEFNRLVGDTASQPLFVYDKDGSLAGGLWYQYFRRVERLDADAAKLRAGRLGLRGEPPAGE
jgi:hypothetical protein